MGDVWPYGPPRFASWQLCFDALVDLGVDRGNANVLAAIAGAESDYDLAVVNDTPSTGDYSVGAWQINYYGNLRAGRIAEFGTPGDLARRGPNGQARAAKRIWEDQGLGAWSTFNNGDYLAHLNGAIPAGHLPRHKYGIPPAVPKPGPDSWSHQIRHSAGHLDGAWHTLDNYANAIHALRG